MPNPKLLKIGDQIRFTALPDEWKQPGFYVHKDDVQFMRVLIRRRWPARISEIDEWGQPWITVRRRRRGRYELHTWAIIESTGWRCVRRRAPTKARKRS